MDQEKKPLLHQDDAAPQGAWAKFRASLTPHALTVLLYAALYVLAGVINSIFLKKVMNSFQNYGFYLNQLTNYGFVPIFGVVVLYQVLFTKQITKEQKAFPWYKFLIMGGIDALNGYFVVIGGIHTTGPMQQLLTQVIIPVTMVGSYIFLKERYSAVQLGGAILITAGVVVSLYPTLHGKGTTGNVPFFNIFFLCQAIPFAAGNLYKDIAFKAVDMDVWYLQFWDVFWQSLIGTLLFPINFVLPQGARIAPTEIFTDMKNGALCTIGHDVYVPPDCSPVTLNATYACDDCTNAWVLLIIYMAINMLYNVFILLVIKHGSATILAIAQTIRLPLASAAFSFKWIMGKDATPFSPYSGAGLAIILVGLIAYRAGSLMKKPTPGDEARAPSRILPRVGPGGAEIYVESVRATPLILPKTHFQQREQYFSRLGIHSPRFAAIQ